jgi:hypothetical protein
MALSTERLAQRLLTRDASSGTKSAATLHRRQAAQPSRLSNNHPSTAEHHHPIGHEERLLNVVRHQEHACVADYLGEFFVESIACQCIECAEWLIQEDQPWLANERARKRNALSLAARKLGRTAIGNPRRTNACKCRLSLRAH